jgi:hypothetical protein
MRLMLVNAGVRALSPADHVAAALRQAAGGEPVARLNARLNAASDS